MSRRMTDMEREAERNFKFYDDSNSNDDMTFERVKTAIAQAYKHAGWGSHEETYYFDGLCEMVLIERDMELAEQCPRHRIFRFNGSSCVDCIQELAAA